MELAGVNEADEALPLLKVGPNPATAAQSELVDPQPDIRTAPTSSLGIRKASPEHRYQAAEFSIDTPAADTASPTAAAIEELLQLQQSLEASDSLQCSDQGYALEQTAAFIAWDSSSSASCKRQLQLTTVASVPAENVNMHPTTAVAAHAPANQQQRHDRAAITSSGDSFSPQGMRVKQELQHVAAARPEPQHAQQQQILPMMPAAAATGSSSAAGCSSATATAPQGSTHSGFASGTPHAAAESGVTGALPGQHAMHPVQYQHTQQAQLQMANDTGFRTPYGDQGLGHPATTQQGLVTQHPSTLRLQHSSMPGQPAEQGFGAPGCLDRLAAPGQGCPGVTGATGGQHHEPFCRSSSTDPSPGVQYAAAGHHQHHAQQQMYPGPNWHHQQQREMQYQQPPTATYPGAPAAAHPQMQDLSMQYHSLAAQQQMLRSQLDELQHKERLLLQRQASAGAAPAEHDAGPSKAYNAQMLAAWQSFTAEGPDLEQIPPSLPQLRTKSAPAVPAAPTAALAATRDVQQQSDQNAMRQHQQQQKEDDASPVCVMDSSGGSDSSDNGNKQQVAAVVANLVDNVVAHMQPAATAADDQDELTSSGDNGHNDDDLAAATAAAMSWMMADHSPAAASGAGQSAPAVLAPTDSCSPMLPSTRRKQQQQQQSGNMPGSTQSLTAAAEAAAAVDLPCTATPGNVNAMSTSTAAVSNIGQTNAPDGCQNLRIPTPAPGPGAVQSGPMSNNNMCVLDVLDFSDDLVPAGMMLDDLLDFGSPPRAHGSVATPGPTPAAAAAAGYGTMQQPQNFVGGNSSSRRPSWAANSPSHTQQQHWQPQQPGVQQHGYPPAAGSGSNGGNGMHVPRSSNSGMPPMPQYPGTVQPGHRQAAASGLHHVPSWHTHMGGRPTVTTGSSQGYNHTLGPHVVSTFQQQQQQQQQQQRVSSHSGIDYALQRGYSMAGAGPGNYHSGGGHEPAMHQGYAQHEPRVPSMASCPPDMLNRVGSAPPPSAAAVGYSRQQQQPMLMSPRTQSWSAAQQGLAAGSFPDHHPDLRHEACLADPMHRHPVAAASGGGWQQQPQQRFSSHGVETSMAPDTYYNPPLQHHSRTVITGENPVHHLQHHHLQQQQQQQEPPMHTVMQMPRPHQHGGSPFGNAQAQNAQFRSLGVPGPMSGPGPDSLRISGPGLDLPGPGPDGLRLPSQSQPGMYQHSYRHASYTDQGVMHQQQHLQQPPPLDRFGSAPIMPSQLHMQPSGPGGAPLSTGGFSTGPRPGSALQPAPSAPQGGPSCGAHGLYSQASGPAKPHGPGYGSSTASATTQQQQQGMKIKLKVQLQPVKRGRGRPPSRARLAAKEVDIIPVPVRDDEASNAAADPAAPASGIRYLDTPSTTVMPVQHYGMYSRAASTGFASAANLSAVYNDPSFSVAAAGGAGNGVGGYGGSDGGYGASQLQRKRSGQISGLEAPKSVKSIKLESSSNERPNSTSSNSTGNSGGSAPKKKSGMPIPIIRNGIMIPPPAGPEMTARGKPTFSDLVQAGAFPPGTYEFSVGTVQSVTASIASSGVITYENEQYQSISSFALAAARSRNPNRQACDGWKEVRLQGKKLEIWRQAFLNKLPPPAIPQGCIKSEPV